MAGRPNLPSAPTTDGNSVRRKRRLLGGRTGRRDVNAGPDSLSNTLRTKRSTVRGNGWVVDESVVGGRTVGRDVNTECRAPGVMALAGMMNLTGVVARTMARATAEAMTTPGTRRSTRDRGRMIEDTGGRSTNSRPSSRSSTTGRSDPLGLQPRSLGAPLPCQVTLDTTKVLHREILRLFILGAIPDAVHDERQLFFIAQMRTLVARADMRKVAERTPLVAGELERAIAHRVGLVARQTFSDAAVAGGVLVGDAGAGA